MLVAAIDREATAVAALAAAPGLRRASTRTTALSQHCLCGTPVAKALGDRVHDCPACGLVGDRDAVAATLAAYVVFADPTTPTSATVDYVASQTAVYSAQVRAALAATLPFVDQGRQDAPSESNALSARDGSFVTAPGRTPDRTVAVARRIGGTALRTTPNELGRYGCATSDRAWLRTTLPSSRGAPSPQLRDSS
jgi:hypothetical protein